MNEPSIACENIETTKASRVECPTCDKQYAIIIITHKCNPVAPCAVNRPAILQDRPLNDRQHDGSVPKFECMKCVRAAKKKTAPKKGLCSQCGFEGWFAYTADDKRCPACKTPEKESAPKLKRPPTAKPTPVTAKVGLHLLLETQMDGPDFCDSHNIKIHIRGYTDESITTSEWFPVEYNSTFEPDLVSAEGDNLCDFLKEMGEKYIITWHIDKKIDWILLKYVHKQGRAEVPLGEPC